ncbi:MAG: hypothetical protein ABR569_04350 [Gaiellaceae bacterium]
MQKRKLKRQESRTLASFMVVLIAVAAALGIAAVVVWLLFQALGIHEGGDEAVAIIVAVIAWIFLAGFLFVRLSDWFGLTR